LHGTGLKIMGRQKWICDGNTSREGFFLLRVVMVSNDVCTYENL